MEAPPTPTTAAASAAPDLLVTYIATHAACYAGLSLLPPGSWSAQDVMRVTLSAYLVRVKARLSCPIRVPAGAGAAWAASLRRSLEPIHLTVHPAEDQIVVAPSGAPVDDACPDADAAAERGAITWICGSGADGGDVILWSEPIGDDDLDDIRADQQTFHAALAPLGYVAQVRLG